MSRRFLTRYWQELLLGFLIIAYTLYFSWFTFTRHDNLYSMRYDLGNMDQTVWNTTQGRIFTFTDPAGDKTISRFAIHADFFLVFLAPFYFFFPTPKVLLFIQSLGLSLGAIPLYLLAKRLLHGSFMPLMFAVSYLFYPAMERANIYEFHAVTLATPFLLAAFYFAYLKKYRWFLLFSFFAATTKEEIPLLIFMIGVFIFFINKDRFWGMITMFFSLLWFVAAVWVIIPYFRQGLPHFGASFFSEYGEGPTEIVRGFFTSPITVFETIFSQKRLYYLWQLLLPVGFLSFLSPAVFVLALPEILINLLSKIAQMQTINYQYTSGITPFVFLSALFGYSFLRKKFPNLRLTLAIYFISFTLLGFYLFSPLPLSMKPDLIAVSRPNVYAKSVHKFENIIPHSASLSVTNNIAPHFTRRENVYSFPTRYKKTDFTIVLAKGSYESVPEEKLLSYAESLLIDPHYSLIFRDKDFFVFKRK